MVAAARGSVAGKAYDLASSGQTLEEFGEAAKCLAAMERIEVKRGYLRIAEEHLNLARQQAELEREKFEINTARLALAVHAAIGHREDYIQVIKSDKLMFIPRDYLL